MTDQDDSEHTMSVDGMVDDGGGRGTLFNADEYTGSAVAGADGSEGADEFTLGSVVSDAGTAVLRVLFYALLSLGCIAGALYLLSLLW
ncbi:hypothetical protein [Halomicrobium salinisoli]|uniref:hypothetical protein n=1 Tax=Halomicrobium salinisoli TaxID=2878391 RepID=UPI001CF0B588|nr:hypothetical protein [Halomicrobium salinisoli]